MFNHYLNKRRHRHIGEKIEYDIEDNEFDILIGDIQTYLEIHENELEIRLGFFNPFNNKFRSEVLPMTFEKLRNTFSKKNNHKPIIERSLVCNLGGNKSKVIYFNDDNEPNKIVLREKSNLRAWDLLQYGIRISLSSEDETELANKKITAQNDELSCFRYRHRLSYIYNSNWRVDMTKMIKIRLGEFNYNSWHKYLDKLKNDKDIVKANNKLSNKNNKNYENPLLAKKINPFTYEVEVEYIGKREINTEKFADSFRSLMKHITSIYKPPEYLFPAHGLISTGTELFNQLRKANGFLKHVYPEIKENYSVGSKVDGERALIIIDPLGSAYLIDNIGNKIKLTNMTIPKKLHSSFIDGEYVADLKLFVAFELLVKGGIDFRDETYNLRYDQLSDFDGLKSNELKIEKMTVHRWDIDIGPGKKFKTIYDAAGDILCGHKYPYELDGLVFVPLDLPYKNNYTYKWKPSHYQTIDFLIKFRDIKNANVNSKNTKNTNKNSKSKLICVDLYLGANKETINQLNLRYDLHDFPYLGGKLYYFPVKFELPALSYRRNSNARLNLGSTCIPVIEKNGKYYYKDSTKNMIEIFDMGVYEMSYNKSFDQNVSLSNNNSKNKKSQTIINRNSNIVKNIKWKILRVRDDKNRKFQKSKKEGKFAGPNDFNSALKEWSQIHDPVTTKEISGGRC